MNNILTFIDRTIIGYSSIVPATCCLPGAPHRRQKHDVPGSALAHEMLWDVSRGVTRLPKPR